MPEQHARCKGTMYATSKYTLVLSFALVVPCSSLSAAEPDENRAASIDDTLNKVVTIEVIDLPMKDLFKEASVQTGADFRFDLDELDAAGFDPASSVITAEIRGVKLKDALNWILDERELAWRKQGESIEITTLEEVEVESEFALLDVNDLVRREGSTDIDEARFADLQQFIVSTIAPDAWSDVGGNGNLQRHRGKLLVQQTSRIIAQVRRCLAALREARNAAQAHADSAPEQTSFGISLYPEIEAKLDQPLQIVIDEQSIHDAIRKIQDKHQVPLIIDHNEIELEGLDLEALVSVTDKSLKLRNALIRICHSRGLDWFVWDGALVLTSQVCERALDTRFYPVLDLLGDSLPGDEFNDERRDFGYDDLQEVITTAIDAISWDKVGGAGAIDALPNYGLLAVSQTQQNHADIERLLSKLRHELAQHPGEKRKPMEKVDNPMRLVVYSFATPDFEKEQKQLAIKKAEAKARAKRAAAATAARMKRPTNSNLKQPSHQLPELNDVPPRYGGDPFAPEKPPHELGPFEDESPLGGDDQDDLPDVVEKSLPDQFSEIESPGESRDPFGPGSPPFDFETNPLNSLELGTESTGTMFEDKFDAYNLYPERSLPIAEDEFLKIITSVIEPASWVRDEGTIALAAHRRIVIRHTDQVHRKIQKLAERLGVKGFREWHPIEGFSDFGFGGGFF